MTFKVCRLSFKRTNISYSINLEVLLSNGRLLGIQFKVDQGRWGGGGHNLNLMGGGQIQHVPAQH